MVSLVLLKGVTYWKSLGTTAFEVLLHYIPLELCNYLLSYKTSEYIIGYA